MFNELSNLIVQIDLGILEVSRPFDLFGPQPHKGSAFYIGHQEALHKKVHYININFDWYKLPDNFQNHYAAYSKEQNQQFAIDIQVLHQNNGVQYKNKITQILNIHYLKMATANTSN